LKDSYINRTMRNNDVKGDRIIVKREISKEPTNILMERRLVRVKELKNEEKSSIRKSTRRNE